MEAAEIGGKRHRILALLLLLSMVAIIPCIQCLNDANSTREDVYWEERKRDALRRALSAYNPNPHEVINSFNQRLTESIMEEIGVDEIGRGTSEEGQRRVLQGEALNLGHHNKNKRRARGPCVATNPIDACWRCDPNWANNRKRLADCALGFGRKTTGGRDGRIYVVTDESDDSLLDPKPGTLRHAVIQTEPLWIIFSKNMVITLKNELIMVGNKTIDGRGVIVHIAHGAGICIQYVDNVIIHGIKIHHIPPTGAADIRDSITHHGLRMPNEGDGISLFGATNIWLDHLSMSQCSDGLIDAVQSSTAVTISNCHFTHHDHVMLLGASDTYSGDKIMQITVAFNHFGKKLVQRMPRVRWGLIHIVNNDYTHWEMYAIGGSMHPTVISQGNRFIAPMKTFAKEVTHRDYAPESQWRNWVWITDKDTFINGAYFRASGTQTIPNQGYTKDQFLQAQPGTNVGRLTKFAGRLNCKIGRKC